MYAPEVFPATSSSTAPPPPPSIPSWVWLAGALWIAKAAAGGYLFHRVRRARARR